jgi:hypothetical protein
MFYNFGLVHQTFRVTPAMERGIADHVWSIKASPDLNRPIAIKESEDEHDITGFHRRCSDSKKGLASDCLGSGTISCRKADCRNGEAARWRQPRCRRQEVHGV